MAGRIRSIKPELLTDAKAARLSDGAWRCFVSCLLLADDFGRFVGDPLIVGGQVFPVKPSKAEAAIGELIDAGMFLSYQVRGQVYLQITNWAKHQRIDNAGRARCPEPEESMTCDSRNLAENFRGFLPDQDKEHDEEQEGDRDRLGGRSRRGPPVSVKETTEAVVGAFNATFDRKLSPGGWESSVQRLIFKGYTEAQMRGVVWWAAREWSEDPDMRAKLSPKTLLKLQSSQGYRTFGEYLSCAGERWRSEHDGERPPWEASEPTLQLVTGDA